MRRLRMTTRASKKELRPFPSDQRTALDTATFVMRRGSFHPRTRTSALIQMNPNHKTAQTNLDRNHFFWSHVLDFHAVQSSWAHWGWFYEAALHTFRGHKSFAESGRPLLYSRPAAEIFTFQHAGL